MKITFPVELMNKLFSLANVTGVSPAKLTVLSVQEYVDNYNNKENTTSDSKSDNDRN
jgi:hypothetical protein